MQLLPWHPLLGLRWSFPIYSATTATIQPCSFWRWWSWWSLLKKKPVWWCCISFGLALWLIWNNADPPFPKMACISWYGWTSILASVFFSWSFHLCWCRWYAFSDSGLSAIYASHFCYTFGSCCSSFSSYCFALFISAPDAFTTTTTIHIDGLCKYWQQRLLSTKLLTFVLRSSMWSIRRSHRFWRCNANNNNSNNKVCSHVINVFARYPHGEARGRRATTTTTRYVFIIVTWVSWLLSYHSTCWNSQVVAFIAAGTAWESLVNPVAASCVVHVAPSIIPPQPVTAMPAKLPPVHLPLEMLYMRPHMQSLLPCHSTASTCPKAIPWKKLWSPNIISPGDDDLQKKNCTATAKPSNDPMSCTATDHGHLCRHPSAPLIQLLSYLNQQYYNGYISMATCESAIPPRNDWCWIVWSLWRPCWWSPESIMQQHTISITPDHLNHQTTSQTFTNSATPSWLLLPPLALLHLRLDLVFHLHHEASSQHLPQSICHRLQPPSRHYCVVHPGNPQSGTTTTTCQPTLYGLIGAKDKKPYYWLAVFSLHTYYHGFTAQGSLFALWIMFSFWIRWWSRR